MTQAFNLSQLANLVNTSGQLNAATGLFNQTPVANGGTGLSTVTAGALLLGAGTSAMTELTGTTPGTTVVSSPTGWTAAPSASVAGGNYVARTYTSPAVYTKPGTVKAIKVTVVGAGGNGGGVNANPTAHTGGAGGGGGGGGAVCYFDAPAIPGSPITITAGSGTNSFGPLVSATAGAAGTNIVAPANNSIGGAGGTGTVPSPAPSGALAITGGTGFGSIDASSSAAGANSLFGLGIGGVNRLRSLQSTGPGYAATGYGAGGGGAMRNATTTAQTGGAGSPGVVIVEEFY
jgi:hypothetical protein